MSLPRRCAMKSDSSPDPVSRSKAEPRIRSRDRSSTKANNITGTIVAKSRFTSIVRRRGRCKVAAVRVAVGDTHLYFDVEGMGLVPDGPTMRERPVVVCLHGGPGFDHSMLKTSLAPLGDVAQLVFPDHRTQGRSDPSEPARWNLDTWIQDLRGLCEALGLERPIIFGQSFG